MVKKFEEFNSEFNLYENHKKSINYEKKLSKKFIKSFIDDELFYDGTKLDGISMKKNSYDLFYSNYDGAFILRTSPNNPLLNVLREHFDVIYNRHFYLNYYEYIIKQK